MNVLNHRIDLETKSGALHSFVLVIVGVLLLAGLMALSTPSWDAALSVSSSDAAPPAVPPIEATASGTGVPAASTVFGDPVDAPDEAPSTF